MPRAKRGGRRGNSMGAEVNARNPRSREASRGKYKALEAVTRHVSMAEEARNTDHRHGWDSSTRLRDGAVRFVSAGFSNEDVQDEPRSRSPIEEHTDRVSSPTVEEHQPTRDAAPYVHHRPDEYGEIHDVKMVSLDPHYNKPAQSVAIAGGLQIPQPSDGYRSDSSGEVVLFTGRNRNRPAQAAEQDDVATSVPSEFDFEALPQNVLHQRQHYDAQRIGLKTGLIDAHGEASAPSTSTVHHREQQLMSTHNLDLSEDAFTDYIENINRHEIDDEWEEDEVGTDDLADNGKRAKYTPIQTTVSAFKSGDRHMSQAAQALPVSNAPDTYKVTPVSDVTDGDNDSLASLDTIGQATRDLQEAFDDEVSNGHLFASRMAGMTDEELAHRLAKQSELGLDTDELLLLDGGEGNFSSEEDLEYLRQELGHYSHKMRAKRGQGNMRSGNNKRGALLANSVIVSPYEDFDVVDRSRHSIQKSSQGRYFHIDEDMTDSDIEEMLQESWQNDRRKKKERKLQREELRAQGALGNKKGKINMKAKYAEGMDLAQVKEEIKVFLGSQAASLSLPPMDKRSRKIVHDLANAFNLKSKSVGSGKKRYPCLYRTTRSLPFEDAAFRAIEARVGRKYFPRIGMGNRRHKTDVGGDGSATAGYRDGDIVGASAPELGVENKGRAMLEKMGWSNGTALGALNNKGMLQPVAHVVKKSRAGLG